MARLTAYENYCEYCRRLGIEPASFTGWATGAGDPRRHALNGAHPHTQPRKKPTSYIGWFVLVILIAIVLVVFAARSPTAICMDGSPSYSGNDQGTCSWHGGVKSWR